MGNRLSLLEHEESDGKRAATELAFYRTLKLKNAKSLLTQIAENMVSDFDIYNDEDSVSWGSFLKIICALRDSNDTDLDAHSRSKWHSATSGYMMERLISEGEEDDDDPELEFNSNCSTRLADYHTDDDEFPVSAKNDSNETDDMNQGKNDCWDKSRDEGVTRNSGSLVKASLAIQRRNEDWNSEILSPIFFGFSTKSIKQYKETSGVEASELKKAEERAVVRTKMSRADLLDGFQTASKNQDRIRLRKILQLEELYNVARVKRETILKRMQTELPQASFKAFKVREWLCVVNSKYDLVSSSNYRLIVINLHLLSELKLFDLISSELIHILCRPIFSLRNILSRRLV